MPVRSTASVLAALLLLAGPSLRRGSLAHRPAAGRAIGRYGLRASRFCRFGTVLLTRRGRRVGRAGWRSR